MDQVRDKDRGQDKDQDLAQVRDLGRAARSTAVHMDTDMEGMADTVDTADRVGKVDMVILPRRHLRDTAGWEDKVRLEGKGADTPLESPLA
jgi:hypothetical protein